MAFELHISEADRVFLGEDKSLVFPIYVAGTTLRDISAGTAVLEDATLWTLEWLLWVPGDEAVITKTTGSGISIAAGVPAVAIAQADSEDLEAVTYRHALWRTDAAQNALLTYGTFTFATNGRP